MFSFFTSLRAWWRTRQAAALRADEEFVYLEHNQLANVVQALRFVVRMSPCVYPDLLREYEQRRVQRVLELQVIHRRLARLGERPRFFIPSVSAPGTLHIDPQPARSTHTH